MSDTKESMPAQPTTINLDKPPSWAIALGERMAKGFETTNARLAGIETTVDTLVEDGKAANQRMTRIEVRMDTLEGRADQSSLRVRGESETNLKQDSTIAAILEKVDALTTKTDAQTVMLTEAKTAASRVLANPMVRSILTMLGTAILTWLAAHGGVK